MASITTQRPRPIIVWMLGRKRIAVIAPLGISIRNRSPVKPILLASIQRNPTSSWGSIQPTKVGVAAPTNHRVSGRPSVRRSRVRFIATFSNSPSQFTASQSATGLMAKTAKPGPSTSPLRYIAMSPITPKGAAMSIGSRLPITRRRTVHTGGPDGGGVDATFPMIHCMPWHRGFR